MGRKTVEEKRLDYEKANGFYKEELVERKRTSIKEITTNIYNEVKSFNTLESLLDFVKCLNPMFMNRFKEEQKGILKIEGLGTGVKVDIL